MVRNGSSMRNLIGPLFLLVSCLLFSVTGTLQQLAPEGHTPVVITEVRMLLGSLTILAWCLLNHRLPSNWSAVPWKPMLIAVASVLLYQLLFFYSVAEVGVAVGSRQPPEEGAGINQGVGHRCQLRLLRHRFLPPGHGLQPRRPRRSPPPIRGLRTLPLRSQPLHGHEPQQRVQDAPLRRQRRHHHRQGR